MQVQASNTLRPAVALFLFLSYVPVFAGSVPVYPGATTQENVDLSQAIGSRQGGTFSANLKTLDDFLQAHTDNRPGRISRASMLLFDGQIEKAKLDIDYLMQKSPDFPGALALKSQYAFLVGSKELSIACDRQAIADAKANLPYTQLPFGNIPQLMEARLKDDEGDGAGAEQAFQDWAKADPKTFSVLLTSTYANFHMRHGKYQQAAAEFSTMSKDPAMVVDRGLCIAQALWADGDKDKAFDALMDLLQNEDNIKKKQGSNYFPPEIVLHAYCLTHAGNTGTPEDRAKTEDAVKRLAQGLDLNDMHRWDVAMAWAAGKLPAEDAVKQTEKILKSAPNLDWALWTYMYLGMSSSQESQRIAKNLPAGSVQRHILEDQIKSK